ncbi:hypothetical protein HUK80_00060 [Flavobacterium sp. MAH-1]|uniref:Fibronectin type-III domain-containing protein n=1 Tax=Flavobacterium agri TaxID=2743471 RepID=A0A7Y8XYP0_9FLAO|nr:hypothetical protein [Flavobacterium agri]NUY79269.1 hypothetical protein [Flavobacterium agri]NYA69293.1 hypothetical protein [Flavobacterium agri]
MKAINKIVLILLGLLCFSCEDIIEEDISDDTVTAVFPSPGTVVQSNVVTFQWQSLEGADEYRVQVYSSNQVIVADTLFSGTQATLPMNPGHYQWRVRGENSAYESSYSFPNAFDVVESDDLSQQQVILTAPAPDHLTNAPDFILSWEELSAADYYRLEILDVTNSSSLVYSQDNITQTSLTLNTTMIDQEGEYKWRVKAVNADGSTVFSSRNFSLDMTVPNAPQNSLPADEANFEPAQTVSFSWTQPQDSGVIQSAISYIIEISTNQGFTNIIQSSSVSATNFQQAFANTGDYYWRVKAKDAAGNISVPGPVYKFTVE